jgi:hypothetical protein
MDARSLAIALGGEVSSTDRILCPGPGHSPRDRSLSVRLDPCAPDGFLVHSFSSDDFGVCRDYVRRYLGLARSKTGTAPRTAARRSRATTTTTDYALAFWQRSTDAHDTVIEAYLRSRHLELPAGNAVIRHHPDFGPHGEPDAIMVALMRDVVTDQPVAVHRTYIDHTGRKTGRKILGGPCGGAAVKLAPATDVLVVAEGVETALAATAAGMTPVWAMGSASAIGALAVLPEVATLVILAEIDGGASRNAIASCTNRWSGADGKKAFVVVPTAGDDFAAVWKELHTDWRKGVEIRRVRL